MPIAEQGVPEYDFYGWIALMGPAGMPEAVTRKLYDATLDVTSKAEFVTRMAEMGLSPMRHTRPEMEAFIRFDVARWRDVIGKAGIRAD
jgi:tripartite-type tricarboxylate transporter receptor subunit TctC